MEVSISCTKCGEHKPIASFPKCASDRRGWQQPCKQCSAKATKARRDANPVAHYAKKYSTPEEKIKNLLSKDRCEICGLPMTRKYIDHSHKTGRVRGILCNVCNVGLGIFRDDISILRAAISYLEASE